MFILWAILRQFINSYITSQFSHCMGIKVRYRREAKYLANYEVDAHDDNVSADFAAVQFTSWYRCRRLYMYPSFSPSAKYT